MSIIRSNRVHQMAAIASAMGFVLAVLSSSIGFAQTTTEQTASQADKAEPKAKNKTDGIQIEFRWAEAVPKEGLTESEGVDVSESKEKVFLHKKPILTNQDIATATAVQNKSASGDLYYIDVYLTKDAAKRMAKSSEENLKKSLVVLADGKIISALTPMQPLSDWVLIYGPFPKAEAERIATSIKTKPAAAPGGEPADFKELQGQWEVQDAQASSTVPFALPAETGLTQKGARITIRGNEVLCDGKVVATLTLDFSASRLKPENEVKFGRRPIMLTLPDGKEVLWAFKIENSSIEMVHPHAMGRVGIGSFLYLKRPTQH